MTSYLENPTMAALLAELFAGVQHDDDVIARARATVKDWAAAPTYAQMSDLCADASLAVKPEVGRLLYMLVRLLQPKTIVEFGTSFGVSILHLGAGVKDNGFGKVIGSEMNEAKIAKAREYIERAGLAEVARVLPGDARETLAGVEGPIDLLLLDGWKELYLPVLEVLEPKLRPRSLVVSDNLSMLPEAYLSHVRGSGRYASISLPLSDGIELSMKL